MKNRRQGQSPAAVRFYFLFVFYLQHCAHGVEHSENENSDIAEDRYPHIRDTECAEHEDDHFDRERDPDILVDDAHSLSGYLYRRREL